MAELRNELLEASALRAQPQKIGELRMFHLKIAVAAMLTLAAMPVLSHPKLLAATPAEGTTVTAPKQISLNFSEKLFEQMSGAKLVAMAATAPVAAKVQVSADGKSMTVTPATPLVPGRYIVEWHGVAADTHRVTGAVRFTVK